MDTAAFQSVEVSGEFTDFAGERYYVIRNVDRMPPFFMSVISSSDHWLFVSSAGGLTAGRVSPDHALFPYIPVDRVHESTSHTGSKTVVRVRSGRAWPVWEPFNREHDDRYALSRNLYKSVLGNKLCFEEINLDLRLAFRYTWSTSERYGFVRQCELQNLASGETAVELVDGLQNILPAGTPGQTQAMASNLVDAYKWNELDQDTGLAWYTLYSGISDRAEPCESLRANTAFSIGLEDRTVLLSTAQLEDFRRGRPIEYEGRTRGRRGAYLVGTKLLLPPAGTRRWSIVADVEQTQSQVVALLGELRNPIALAATVARSVAQGADELARLVGTADGMQAAAEETVTAHHSANVLFNILRGGVVDDHYTVPAADFRRTVEHFNKGVGLRHGAWLAGLPDRLSLRDLLPAAVGQADPQLERLCREYLPITFGRRHGDPSRPWNRFTIRLRDARGQRLLSYEGNWRDIFQNWEALAFSFPELIESVIAKFVNASTVDGYNPYRITKDGIDWEVEDPDDPWSYIGYWGDHQIIYLLKLLELSRNFHPDRLSALLRRSVFSYANVPYRIRPFERLLENPKSTVDYDHELADRIARRVEEIGADGRLVLAADGGVCLVNLLEKLLVPLLCKLGNLVVDGGIWLNTQRPEWNDANNALVGHGLSMVTLYYLRRYIRFLQEVLADETDGVELSDPVGVWMSETTAAFARLRALTGDGPVGEGARFESMRELGLAASRYREAAYGEPTFEGRRVHTPAEFRALLDSALAVIDHCIHGNRRPDGLYHAYNLLRPGEGEVGIDNLYPMLEGQVAVLSSGAIGPDQSAALLDALFESPIYRADQKSFLLYPDRDLPGFLDKNRIPAERVAELPVLGAMLAAGDGRIVVRDADGHYRFNADFTCAGDLDARVDALAADYGDALTEARPELLRLYEAVFDHRSFTGRSGSMFGFEGLGCIYWHMVSKLLLAVQERFFDAADEGDGGAVRERLAALYYRVREGLGFNKTPTEYGAFPCDPYSHTPAHGGAQQPGMTGQVKEEVLTRFGELGIRVAHGEVRFDPALLRAREFGDGGSFRFVDVEGVWQTLALPPRALAYTWCQVPLVYRLVDGGGAKLTVCLRDGELTFERPVLSRELSAALFERGGRVLRIELEFSPCMLSGC